MIIPYLEQLTVSITQKEAGFRQHHVEEHIYWIPMPLDVMQWVKQLKKDRIITINGKEISAPTAVSVMSKHHQLCSGTVITDSGEAIVVSDHKLSKIKFLVTMYRKLAIFYKYIAEHDALVSVLGDLVTEDPDEFEESDKKVFIGQFLSKREGINLYTADAIVFYNIDFAYVSYVQAKNRIMNMHRDKKAILIWMFTRGGIEPDIYELVKSKKNYTESYYKKKERIR